MLIANLSDQLGNQMFAYASIKAIALDCGYEFRIYDDNSNKHINDSHKTKGHKVYSIFEIPSKECINNLPGGMHVFGESLTRKSKSAFLPEALHQKDNTLMLGHFICPRYFLHRIGEVRQWFAFPDDIRINVEKRIHDIRVQNHNKCLVSVHIRNADDYRNGGFLLKYEYWIKAAQTITSQLGYEPVFLLFYDEKTKFVESYIERFHCVDMRRNLVEDMCAMAACDHHIVCNSSFSIMAALLDDKTNCITIRPSVFPIPLPIDYKPQDVFHPSWVVVEAEKNYWSEVRRIKKLTVKKVARRLFRMIKTAFSH
jgi:hypothetical protein